MKMGFPKDLIEAALKVTDNNTEGAVNLILSGATIQEIEGMGLDNENC